ncbi:MAG: Ankyrin [Bryobacterales bacterium]|nr:Ankyrin [Bryobacterales bacterium]
MTTLSSSKSIAKAILIISSLALPPFVQADAPTATQIRDAANKAAGIMQSSMAQVDPKVPCITCHHGMLPLFALNVARNHGVTVNETQRRQIMLKTFGAMRDIDAAIQGTHVVDENLDASEIMMFGPELGVAPNIGAALHARRLANLQQPDGHWRTMDARPPQSYSNFMVTAVVSKAVGAYLPDSPAVSKKATIAKARQWLAANTPVTNEDATFRLFGLVWTGATPTQINTAATDLMKRQNPDGGWSSMPGQTSDAYSTGEALYALKSTGKISDAAYNQAVSWLLKTQEKDGSWHVKSRLHEVAQISPPKMDTGFPHGTDQITSMFGTTWAVAALSLALPEQKQPAPDIAEVYPKAEPWIEAAAFGTTEQLKAIDPNARTARGSTALMVVANDPARAATLIQRGADAKAAAESGQTALSVAATYAGTAKLVRQLLALGLPAKLGPKAEFHANPMVEVAWTGDVEVARLLLDAGADMRQPMMRAGFIPMSPLKAAVALQSTEVLREFLKRGADPNHVEDVPLLSAAALANRAESTKVLLEAGANPELKDQYGWTPLMHATKGVDHDVNQTEALIRAAIARGSSPSARR